MFYLRKTARGAGPGTAGGAVGPTACIITRAVTFRKQKRPKTHSSDEWRCFVSRRWRYSRSSSCSAPCCLNGHFVAMRNAVDLGDEFAERARADKNASFVAGDVEKFISVCKVIRITHSNAQITHRFTIFSSFCTEMAYWWFLLMLSRSVTAGSVGSV